MKFNRLPELSGFKSRQICPKTANSGQTAIHLARVYGERKRNFVGQHFWARGYFVSRVDRDEVAIREYIRNQEKDDKRLDQLAFLG